MYILGIYHYWVFAILLMIGFYAVIAKLNLIKKLIGLALFQAAVFLLYTWTVERRQKLVLGTAERSSAIVSSLFPSEVRDRLADDVVESKQKKSKINFQKSIKKHI